MYIDCTIFEEWGLKLNKWAYSKPQLLTITTTDASWKKSIDFSALIVQWVGGFGVGGGHSFFRIQPWRSKIKDIMARFDKVGIKITAHMIIWYPNSHQCFQISSHSSYWSALGFWKIKFEKSSWTNLIYSRVPNKHSPIDTLYLTNK